jgi:hypothetical protein
MTEAKRKRVLLGLFIAAVIFGLLTKPWERKKPNVPADSSRTEERTTVEVASAPAATMDIRTQSPTIQFATTWPRDPFGPHETSEPEPAAIEDDRGTQLRLQGIMRVKEQRACVIGGRTYRSGETVEGWKIVRIESDAVVLADRSGQIRLELP